MKTIFNNRSEIARTATESDFTLIAALRTDGRSVGRVCAEQLGLSEATISRRIAALQASNLIRVRGYIDFRAAGCSTACIIRFAGRNCSAVTAQSLATRPCFYRVSTLAGQLKIVALIVAADGTALLDQIDSVIEAHPGITIDSCAMVLAMIPPFEARTVSHSSHFRAGKESTSRQRLIQSRFIRALQSDFRSTLTALAAEAQISPPSAASLLESITKHNLMKPIVVVDPHFIARPLCAKIEVAVSGNIQTTADAIAAQLPLDWVFICLQTEQIVIEAAVQDEEALMRLVRDIQKNQSVLHVTSAPYSAVHKQEFNWACA